MLGRGISLAAAAMLAAGLGAQVATPRSGKRSLIEAFGFGRARAWPSISKVWKRNGEREMARRCRQIASGQLTTSNGLVRVEPLRKAA